MSAIDLDAARKAAREAQERAERSSVVCARCSGMALSPPCKTCDGQGWTRPPSDVPDLAALVFAMVDRIAYLENEVHNHRVARNL